MHATLTYANCNIGAACVRVCVCRCVRVCRRHNVREWEFAVVHIFLFWGRVLGGVGLVGGWWVRAWTHGRHTWGVLAYGGLRPYAYVTGGTASLQDHGIGGSLGLGQSPLWFSDKVIIEDYESNSYV